MSSLILGFTNSKEELTFENKVFSITDKKVIQNLEKANYKNADSLLVIKSLNNLHISDVIQIRINLADTGTFLASFQKETLTESNREDLLKQIGSLKSEGTLNEEIQLKKVKELMKILGNFRPIYVSFVNSGPIKLTLNDFTIKNLKFPLLVLTKPKKKVLDFSFLKGKAKEEKPEETNYSPIDLFNLDYFFIFLFSLFGSIGIITAIFEIMNKQAIGFFLVILSVAFFVTLSIAMSLTIYPKGKLRHPLLRYYLAIFILVGIIIGIVSGYFISSGLLKTEIENFDYKKLILLSSIISTVVLISTVWLSIPVNKIICKIKSKKKA